MKIRIISSRNDIENLNENEEIIHVGFRPSDTDIFSIVSKCPELKAFQIPSSYIKTLSKSAEMFLDMQGIELIEGNVWGHRRDINEYSEIPDNVYNRIDELKKENIPDEEIVEKVNRESNIDHGFVKFILKLKQ